MENTKNKLVRWVDDNCPPINLNNEAPNVIALVKQTTQLKEENERLARLFRIYKTAYDEDLKVEHHHEVEAEQLLKETEQ